MSTRSQSDSDPCALDHPRAEALPRLSLGLADSRRGMLDGVWWPRSRNPAVELPGLIRIVDAAYGCVQRLMLSATGWDERPRRVVTGVRAVTVDYLGNQPATWVTVVCGQFRLGLRVVSPTAGPRAAHLAAGREMTADERSSHQPTSPGDGQAHQARPL